MGLSWRDGRRTTIIIVFHSGTHFDALTVIVFQNGRYTTETPHADTPTPTRRSQRGESAWWGWSGELSGGVGEVGARGGSAWSGRGSE